MSRAEYMERGSEYCKVCCWVRSQTSYPRFLGAERENWKTNAFSQDHPLGNSMAPSLSFGG